ncbi:MAG: HDOD domain-containing protein [Gammaproteobacteria bacterium]|nr:HDOD domain-containing protein [Gammaproteobacteria bacterium]
MSTADGPTLKLARFEVTKMLGKGMQGAVYLARDPELGRLVALKALTPAKDDADFAEQLISEARIAARIAHPNVVPVYEVIKHKDVPVVVFEYVEGQSLKQWLATNGPCQEDAALSLMVRIAVGLRAAHDQEIVHLDLTPNNIMIDRDGRPRIMDFGLARMMRSEGLRDKNVITGTPRYMTPEHIRNAPLSAATDIFAAGLIFYELLAGTQAISHDSLVTIFKAIQAARIDWKRLRVAQISPELIALLRDMLQVDSTQRIQNAMELVDALDEIIALKKSNPESGLALQFLLRRLQRRPEFPAFSASIAEINKMTDEHSNASFDKVGAVVLRDYSLTNRVMKIANSAFFDRGAGSVTTISGAIGRLGLRTIRMLCNGLMMFDQFGSRSEDLKDAMVRSYFAGLLAREVARETHRRLAEEAFVCGLFHRLGSNLLMYYLFDEYSDIQSQRAKGVREADAERAVIATTSSAVGMAIAAKWRFSEAIVDSMRRLDDGRIPEFNDASALRYFANFGNDVCEVLSTATEAQSLQVQLQDVLLRFVQLDLVDLKSLATLIEAAIEQFESLSASLGVDASRTTFINTARTVLPDVIARETSVDTTDALAAEEHLATSC